jgi:tRNA (cmo5U34)-methyltransferase
MKKVKQHFEEEAKEFDEIIVKLIPYYHQMVNALVNSIHFDSQAKINVIDLGCGTGTIAKKISEHYKNSRIVCLDIATNMIEIAKIKLSNHVNTEFLTEDFSKIEFKEKYDVVVSSLALHHLETDKQKKEFYKKIYEILNESGLFLNADVVLASSEYWQKQNMQQWTEYMKKRVSEQEIKNHWIPKYESEDRPAVLVDQITWLKEIGFKYIDVIWKYFNFSVYGGIK